MSRDKKGFVWLLSCLFLLLVCFIPNKASAQATFNHTQPTLIEKGKSVTLEFEVLGINIQDIQEAFLYYRYDGSIVYQTLKADIERNTVRVTFTIDNLNANSIQYYLSLNLANEVKAYFPNNAAETDSPITVTLVDKQVATQDLMGTTGNIDFNILSPLPDEEIVPEDALIALTLFYNEGEANPDSIKIIFDGVDVTKLADVTPYLITFAPQNLKPGDHSVDIVYSDSTGSKSLTKWTFPTIDPNSRKAEVQRSGTKLATGQVELSARNQSIFGNTDDIYKSSFRVNGSKGWFRYSVNGMLTSQENPRLQAQNRYGVELYAGNVFELQAGHIFPTMNPLIIAGNRIFGVNSAIHLFDRLINVQVMTGEMRRSVTNLYSNVKDTTVVIAQTLDGNDETERRFQLNFENNGAGTYRRNVLGGRFALGNGTNFQLGFNAMKVTDRTSSLNTIGSYTSLLANQPELLNGLSAQQRDELAQDPDMFSAPSSSVKPRDNFMFASDLTIKGFDGKFAVRSDFGMSLLNEDTSTGVLNKARAEELGLDIPDNIANVLDELSWLIIVNENMSYLPLSMSADGVKALSTKFLFFNDTPVPTALLASQNSLNLNVWGNAFQAKYQWVGPEYQTLSNTALRRDIAGYSLSDRFRLFSNTVYVTAGYENFADNLIGSKESTTVTQIINGDLSWFPINRNLPRVSISYRMQARDNSVARMNPYFTSTQQLNSSVRNVEVTGGVEGVIANPRNDNSNQVSFSISKDATFLGLRNDFSINYVNLSTIDNVYAFGDFKSNVYSAGVVSNWSQLPMRTNINFSLNNSDGASGLAKVSIIGVNVGASYFLLNEKLNLFTDFAITANTVESMGLGINDNNSPNNFLDDFYFKDASNYSKSEQNTFILRGGATYNFNQHHALLFDASFTNVSVKNAGAVIPNDRVVQLRYVYRF